MKRLFDICVSLGGLLLLSPMIAAVASIIRKDGGPVFYRGERTGLYGKPFRIYKFRTMVVDAEKVGGASTADDDARITSVGKFLRKYKLDETPQLINVLKGEMSIVGPRPEVKRYTDMFSDEEKAILTVRPGITDWASIWNADEGAVLAGAADPDLAYLELIRPMKLKLQLKYVRERSFWVDLKIIFLTLLAVVQPESQAVREMRRGHEMTIATGVEGKR
ncbi:MAG: sugar transferase [Pseudomonadota bacterium]|nr:sugar transferase [Pseudomonadota bacterium]